MARRPYGADRDASIYIVLMRDITAARPPLLAGIVADDLTGAADTAAGFAVAGLTTIVSWPRMSGGPTLAVDVWAIDIGSRARQASIARSLAGKATGWARTEGAPVIYKKCDSLLRGHIGAEVAGAIEAWHPGALAIVALAFPDAGRTTIDGIQRVAGEPIAPPVASLFEGANLRTRSLGLDVIRSPELGRAMKDARDLHAEVIVCDAVSTADLEAIVRGGTELGSPVVWAGTGGLARAVAGSISARRSADAHRDSPDPVRLNRHGPVLIVCGSRSAIARAQVAGLVADGVISIEVPANLLTRESADADRHKIVERIESSFAQGRDVVITVAPTSGDPDEDFALRVADGLGELLSPFATVVGGVAATGGDTAKSVLFCFGVSALWLVGEVEPGIATSIAVGRHTFAVVTKAGAFGGSDALVKARDTLHKMLRVIA